MRVALIGGIGVHKGYRVLLGCARDARARRLPLEFVVIGHTADDQALLRTGRVFITGRYVEGEAPALLQRECPTLVFLPSVWPETWSYVLDEALAAEIPVVAFDLGAIAERLRAAGTGTLLPVRSTSRQINDQLLQLAAQTSVTPAGDDAIIRNSGEITMNKRSEAQAEQQDGLSAAVQVLPLPPGLYLFSVKSADPTQKEADGPLRLPAMHVGLGPGVGPEQVEFIAAPTTNGAWLFAHDDLLVTKVNGSGVTLVLTSVRGASGEVLSIKVERLDTRAEVSAATAGVAPSALAAAVNGAIAPRMKKGAADGPLPLHVSTHVRSRGDVSFTDAPWAGRVAPGLWIESFSIRPLEKFAADDIEYKGLTGSGFETAWLSDDAMCGTKGMSVPLVGFAVRLKPSALTAGYDCEYSGYFKSGTTIGPLHNGAPCRSSVANDPLEGIQIRISKRASASAKGLAELAARPLATLARRRTPVQRPSGGRTNNASGQSKTIPHKSARTSAKSQTAGRQRAGGAARQSSRR